MLLTDNKTTNMLHTVKSLLPTCQEMKITFLMRYEGGKPFYLPDKNIKATRWCAPCQCDEMGAMYGRHNHHVRHPMSYMPEYACGQACSFLRLALGVQACVHVCVNCQLSEQLSPSLTSAVMPRWPSQGFLGNCANSLGQQSLRCTQITTSAKPLDYLSKDHGRTVSQCELNNNTPQSSKLKWPEMPESLAEL